MIQALRQLPRGLKFVLFSGSEMLMVIDMILAKAMVALTSGAIAEFKLRVVGIGSPANLTAVMIRLRAFLPLCGPGLITEPNHIIPHLFAGPAAQNGNDTVPAEDGDGKERKDRESFRCTGKRQYLIDTENEFKEGKILPFDRDQKENPKLHFRIKERENQEHGYVDIMGAQHQSGLREAQKAHKESIDRAEKG